VLKRSIRATIAAVMLVLAPVAFGQAPPLRDGMPYMSDEILLATRGLPWVYKIRSSTPTVSITTWPAVVAEQALVERAKSLLEIRAAKAIALLDGPTIVYAGYKAPATESSLFYGASITKTVTSLAVGQAICSGKLSFNDRASDKIPELAGKPLGRATVRDLLRTASGAVTPSNPENHLSGNELVPEKWTPRSLII